MRLSPFLLPGFGRETTMGEIVDAGNIREDMFRLILEADLGLRHKHTLWGEPTRARSCPFEGVALVLWDCARLLYRQ